MNKLANFNWKGFYSLNKKCKNFIKIGVCIFFAGNSLILISPSKKLYANESPKNLVSNISSKSFVASALAKTGPAVVTIETQRRVYSQGNRSIPPGLLIDPYFEKFFGFPGSQIPRSRIENGQGSGVIFSSEGLVLTNAHVVEKTDQLMIGLSDGRRIRAEVIGEDSLTDLAVIKLLEKGPWPTAPLGNSDKLNVGDWAIAVGNPFGLENTVTLGIISNLNRNVAQLGISDKRINLIQTDAAINPGNSGGPLLNSSGEVVGINTLVRSGPGAGLGFAIPIHKAKEIANQLIRKGRAIHPMIGVSLSSTPLEDSNGNSLSNSGAVVRYLIPGGPADKGGLKVNDLIIYVGGKFIQEPSDVVNKVNEHGINKPLNFIIIRNKKELNLSISPADMNSLYLR